LTDFFIIRSNALFTLNLNIFTPSHIIIIIIIITSTYFNTIIIVIPTSTYFNILVIVIPTSTYFNFISFIFIPIIVLIFNLIFALFNVITKCGCSSI
jgi:hypothetical protein